MRKEQCEADHRKNSNRVFIPRWTALRDQSMDLGRVLRPTVFCFRASYLVGAGVNST